MGTRRFILNKVVCDRQRDAKICRTIPWSRCMSGSDQECEMVPRQRCVDSCSNDPACGKCDQMRQEGLLQAGCAMGQGGSGVLAPSSSEAPSSQKTCLEPLTPPIQHIIQKHLHMTFPHQAH